MAKVLVTGGAGFIGSHVVNQLVNLGHEVIVIDNLRSGKKENVNSQAKLIEVDLEKINSEFNEDVDVVIHLAAQVAVHTSIQQPLFDAQQNIINGLNLLEFCRKNNVKKVIYANSAAEIGDPKNLPIDETHTTQPLSPYGLSKNIFARYLELYHQLYGLNYTVLRYANVYGPGQDASGEGGVVAIFVKNFLQNKPITIYGDGLQTRDFVYVEDIATATVKAIENGNNTTYNIGSGKEISVNDLFNLVKQETNSNIEPKQQAERSGDIKRSFFSVAKAEKELNWQPETNLAEGIKKTISYFKLKQQS